MSRLGFALAACALLGGCATTSYVTVLPEPGTGRVGSIELLGPDEDSTVLRIDTAGGRAALGKSEPKLTQITPSQMVALAETLAGLPEPPVRFLLYFNENADEFTSESLPTRDRVLAEVARRGPGVTVEIEGYTDREGSQEISDRLSLQRARQVADVLAGLGLDLDIVRVTGRGQRNPLVVSPEGIPEPRNRRVEVVVY